MAIPARTVPALSLAVMASASLTACFSFAPATAQAPLPARIDPSSFGKPTFEEDFKVFDWGQDQTRPAKPHRWRTVFGYGGPLSAGNRFLSGSSFATDKTFTGVRDGKPGATPLGLHPFARDRDGNLQILGNRTPKAALPWVWNKPYYGGAITTKFSFSQLFGYFEIDAKLPAGKGAWPAFWLLPVKGAWPNNGEIDVFEGLGDPNVLISSVISGKIKTVNKKVTTPFDYSAGFHRYGVAWNAREMVWYVDRKEVSRVPTPADMKTQPMFMLLNVAVGGSWGGWPDASTKFPLVFTVREVKAWRLPQ